MFIQTMQGRVRDADLLRAQGERWEAELRPGAVGFLGSTMGVTADGVAFLAARFESEAAARANSDRPEQGEWWAATEPAFDEVSFRDCAEVDTMLGGGSDDAGFVQVIQGRVHDEGAARAMLRESESGLAESRPDVLGGYMAWHGDGGGFTQLVYFRSEAEARAGESGGTDAEVDRRYQEMMAVEPTFFDLTEPLLT